ncbi:MAG: hypothetical protein Q9N26_02905, partial [Aquificota bacterium]|nr:hypothetical protein [Aquificota bacterium]
MKKALLVLAVVLGPGMALAQKYAVYVNPFGLLVGLGNVGFEYLGWNGNVTPKGAGAFAFGKSGNLSYSIIGLEGAG